MKEIVHQGKQYIAINTWLNANNYGYFYETKYELMASIRSIKEELKQNKKLDSYLSLIVNYSIENKTLTFSQEIEGVDLNLLRSKKILNQNTVADDLKFAFKFFEKYRELLNIESNENFTSYTQALAGIKKDFNDKKNVQGFSKLERELWKVAVVEANETYNETFTRYIESLSLKNRKEEMRLFYAGYSAAIQWIQIQVDLFCDNAQQLIKWTKEEDEYNLPLGRLLNGIRNKILEDNSFGMGCFDHLINLKIFDIDLMIPVTTGLYDKFGISFYEEHLSLYVFNKIYSVPIICGLSNSNNITDVDAKLFLSIFQKANKKDSEILIHLSKLLFAILNSSNLSEKSQDKNECIQHLEELVSVNNPNLIRYILRESQYLETQIDTLQGLAVRLINQPHFQINEYLTLINHILWHSENINFFRRVLLALAENCQFEQIAKKLNSSIHKFLETQKREFDELLVDLLIQDKPYCRFIGFDIFNDVTPLDGCYFFDFDILSLEPLCQYKLWVSILIGYREPKSTIPCLLPLLKSKSKFVKEAFICKLEEYSENYGGGLTDVLRDNLDLNDAENKIIFERVEKYMYGYFESHSKIKFDIKELNPQYTQNRIFAEFNKGYSRGFNKIRQKVSEESNSFLNFFNTVHLLKGGGWKMEGKDDISQLARIGVSYSLPRRCFIEPEHFDWEQSAELTKDWSDDYFSEIISILENE